MKNSLLILAVIGLVGFVSCKNTEKKDTETSIEKTKTLIEKVEGSVEKTEISVKKVTPTVEKTESNETESNPLMISETGVEGVKVGDTYMTHSDKFKRATQENGAGTFKGYDIMDKNADVIGFAFPDHEEESKIGMIEITSSNYKTKEGIAVGSTFEEVKKAYPKSETHGSEIESKTSVITRNYYFLLNKVAFNTYQVDESKIKPSTKISKITIKKSN